MLSFLSVALLSLPEGLPSEEEEEEEGEDDDEEDEEEEEEEGGGVARAAAIAERFLGVVTEWRKEMKAGTKTYDLYGMRNSNVAMKQ